MVLLPDPKSERFKKLVTSLQSLRDNSNGILDALSMWQYNGDDKSLPKVIEEYSGLIDSINGFHKLMAERDPTSS